MNRAWALVLLTGCGPDTTAPKPEVFIALQRDFKPYAQWERFDLPDAEVTGSPHLMGVRSLFLNQRPPKGSAAFPIGTVIVKAVGDFSQAFAMAKRGGGYNSAGADGWEWFELAPSTDGSPAIVWRGITPPAGEKYSKITGGTCNDCHSAAKANDFVQAEPLQLSGL